MNIKNFNNLLKLINDYEEKMNNNHFYIELITNVNFTFVNNFTLIINFTFVIANNVFIKTLR